MEKDTIVEYYTQNIIGSDERIVRSSEFTINEQCASITCTCLAPLEVYSNLSTTCECGRQYRMETVLHVEWAINNENGDDDDDGLNQGM